MPTSRNLDRLLALVKPTTPPEVMTEVRTIAKEIESELRSLRATVARLDQGEREWFASLNSTLLAAAFERPLGFFVYVLWDNFEQALYVGQSINLFDRLGKHMRRDSRFHQEVFRISIHACDSKASMDELERELIRELLPEHNIQFTAKAGYRWEPEEIAAPVVVAPPEPVTAPPHRDRRRRYSV
jgi:predicted GIY-YIG superfamily endonuclease